MTTIGRAPKLRYQRDGDRYIVMLGEDRAGFVRQMADGRWSAVDTFMRKTRIFLRRRTAGAWLQKETEQAIAAGEF